MQIASEIDSLFLEIITHDYYGQWVSQNALCTALSVAIAGAQEKAQQPLQEGEMQPYKAKGLGRGKEHAGRGEYTVKLGERS